MHFLDIPADVAADPACPFAVLPVPYERSTTYRQGAAGGPEAILRASHETEDYDDFLKRPIDLRVQTLPSPPLEGLDDPEALERIGAAAAAVFGAGRFLLSLGGEHTITAPLVAAAAGALPGLTVLSLDAHLDLRESYQGNRLSHACVMRRVREQGLETVHVGTRSGSCEEVDYAEQHDIPIVWADAFPDGDGAASAVLRHLGETVYLSVDIDVFDPALVPGTGTPEPGGPGWAPVIALLHDVFKRRTVVGADIVEVAPVPGSVVSEFTAAKLGQKLLSFRSYYGS